MTRPNQLTQLHIRFCEHYVANGGNAKQAMLDAGYSPTTADSASGFLLTKPIVRDYIARLQVPRRRKIEATADRVLEELCRIAFSDPRELYDEWGRLRPIHELEDHVAATVSEVKEEIISRKGDSDDEKEVRTKRVKLWDKMKALEMLAKHLKLYADTAPTAVNFFQVNSLQELSDDERAALRALAEARVRRSSQLIEGTRQD